MKIFGEKSKIAFEIVHLDNSFIKMNLWFFDKLTNSEDNSFYLLVFIKNIKLEIEKLSNSSLEIDYKIIYKKSNQEIFYYMYDGTGSVEKHNLHKVLDYDIAVTRLHCMAYEIDKKYFFLGSYLNNYKLNDEGDNIGSLDEVYTVTFDKLEFINLLRQVLNYIAYYNY